MIQAVPAVELKGLAKSFGDCKANQNVSFKVSRGSVHALVGENGAGKSTAMKMLYGLIKPDEGEILVGGKVVTWRSPKDAIRAGIGMVHQHFMLAEPLSGLDNIVLGAEPATSAARFLPPFLRPIDRQTARAKLVELSKTYRLDVDLDRPVSDLPVGLQQRLEILKLLYRSVDILILDEPTAVLTPSETDELFRNLKRLTAEGKTILIITHKLDEVLQFADRATVLRRGAVVKTVETAETTAAELAELMVGRAVQLTVKAPPKPELGASALKLETLTVGRKGERPRLQDIHLEVRRGEILGVAGVEGNGQSDLLALLADPRRFFTGLHPLATGTLEVHGQDVRRLAARDVRRLGMGLVPEDRHRQGLILDFDLVQNFLLGHQRTPEMSRLGFVQHAELQKRVVRAIDAFDIRPTDPKSLAGSLSGGNQQKVVIARELERAPKLFVAAQPTRGVDVGSIEFIHQRILDARAADAAVLLVSSSLDEIRALSDRIIVLFEGRIVATFNRGEADQAALGKAMGGARHD